MGGVMSAVKSKHRMKNAKPAAEIAAAAEHARLVNRIRNLFELENWSTERIAEAVELPRSEVIRLIQQSSGK